MPRVTIQKSSRALLNQKLRAVSPADQLESDDGADTDATLSEVQPDLDDPWAYSFCVSIGHVSHLARKPCPDDIARQPGDNVWIRTAGGQWLAGCVSGQRIRKGDTRVVSFGRSFLSFSGSDVATLIPLLQITFISRFLHYPAPSVNNECPCRKRAFSTQ
jgi:hypothetical protein